MAPSAYQKDQVVSSGRKKDQDVEASSKYVFVDPPNYPGARSPATRRQIHQHAMKEIGKSRRRPKKNPTIQLDTSPLAGSALPLPFSPWLGILRCLGSGRLDPFLHYPIELNATARELLAYSFDDEIGQQRPLRDAWFTVGLQDEAAFTQILSNSALHMEHMRRKGEAPRETKVSLYYYIKTITSTRNRVDMTNTKTLEGVIGAVTGMMAHADILGSTDDWVTHHKGIQQLVRMRGGIERLEGNEALRLTISWCELRGVYLLDQQPRFPLPREWIRYVEPQQPSPALASRIWRTRRMWLDGDLSHSEWHNIYAHLVCFSFQSFEGYASMSKATKLSGEFGAWMNPMIHRLLSWRPADGTGSRESVIQETCRLGALLYIIPAWRLFGVSPVISRVLRQKLKALTLKYDVDWSHAWSLKLWALYMGAVESISSEDESWYVEQIAATLVENGVMDWTKGLKLVKDILWFDCLFVDRNDRVSAMLEQLPSLQSVHNLVS